MPISEDEFSKLCAIWMIACYDQDAIITYEGIAHRLSITVEEAKSLVGRQPELFSPVISQRWFDEWRDWVKIPYNYAQKTKLYHWAVQKTKLYHWPVWILDNYSKHDDRLAQFEKIKRDGIFRSQLRVRGADPWRKGDPAPPGDGPIKDSKEVALGLEHLDRLRRAGAEERAHWLTRGTALLAFLVPMLALVVTSFLTYRNMNQTSRISYADALTKRWDLTARIRNSAYEDTLEAMQTAFEAFRNSKGDEVKNKLTGIHSNLYRLEPFLGDARKEPWRSDYDELSKLVSGQLGPPNTPELNAQFQTISDRMHCHLYNALFGPVADELSNVPVPAEHIVDCSSAQAPHLVPSRTTP